MDDMQNTLKEVDLQIIYRRIEARKRNITKNGQMSKRQLATAYRGYHGLEAQYHALVQMSSTSMMNTKVKNDHLQQKHADDLKQLIEQERLAQNKTEKEIKTMRDDFTAQLAYQYVYKNHSFKRIYKSQQEKKPRPVSDKPEFYEIERRNSAKMSAPRPLGSLRQIEIYKDELKIRFPPIANDKHGDNIQSPRVNMMGGKPYSDPKSGDNKNTQGSDITSFPNIENAMGIKVKFDYKPPFDDDNISAITAPPARIDVESDDETSHVNPNLISFDMGRNLMRMRIKEKEKLEKKRFLPATPDGKTVKQIEGRKTSWRRVLPETPPKRPSTVYPAGARSPTDLKKIMRKEAENVIDSWANTSSKRQEVVQLAKEHHLQTLADNPIPVFDKSRPTSAILRDFKEYKRIQGEQVAMREEAENDQSIIVRQMSPLPRTGSPVAQSRNDYIRKLASRGGQRPIGTPSTTERPSRIHRTESEKFPSVSRTSSYQQVPDADMCPENALLTAAERIEKEKQKLSEQKDNKQPEKSESDEKVKRRLPPTPKVSSHTYNDWSKTTDKKTNNSRLSKMFNTKILATDKDIDMINKVQLANLLREGSHLKSETATNVKISKNDEHKSYVPGSNQSNPDEGMMPFPADSLSRIKATSSVYGKDFWPKLSKMQFNYENFSRTTPEMKKRLEMKAKNRRKISQKNAQLAEEIKMKANTKLSDKVEESDRPSTRVSFNENVIVFQTI